MSGARGSDADYHLRRVGARLLYRLSQRARQVRRCVLESGELGFREREFAIVVISRRRDLDYESGGVRRGEYVRRGHSYPGLAAGAAAMEKWPMRWGLEACQR